MAKPPSPSSPPLSSNDSIAMGAPSPPPMILNSTTTAPEARSAVETTIDPQQAPSLVSERSPAAAAAVASLTATAAAGAGSFLSDQFDRRAHVASNDIGLLTPPLNTDTAKQPQLMTATTAASYAMVDVVHDVYSCMFKIALDNKGTTAALCYLPTRFQSMVEFYHTEIPVEYRALGVGELLVVQGFLWAETSRLLVIPTCPFVQRYLGRNQHRWGCVVNSESDGLSRLIARAK